MCANLNETPWVGFTCTPKRGRHGRRRKRQGHGKVPAVTDLRDKLQDYFRAASIAHYLIVDPDKRIVIHRAGGTGDVVATRIVSEGTVRLDPPRIEITVGELFG
jgi:hypothetical protein